SQRSARRRLRAKREGIWIKPLRRTLHIHFLGSAPDGKRRSGEHVRTDPEGETRRNVETRFANLNRHSRLIVVNRRKLPTSQNRIQPAPEVPTSSFTEGSVIYPGQLETLRQIERSYGAFEPAIVVILGHSVVRCSSVLVHIADS